MQTMFDCRETEACRQCFSALEKQKQPDNVIRMHGWVACTSFTFIANSLLERDIKEIIKPASETRLNQLE